MNTTVKFIRRTYIDGERDVDMEWKNVWGYSQMDYRSWPSHIADQIQVIRMRANHHTEKIRVRLSNLFGTEQINFEHVTVKVLKGSELTIIDEKAVKVNGNERISIAEKEEIVSDELSVRIKPGDILIFTTELAESVNLTSGTVTYSRKELDVFNYRGNIISTKNFVEQRELFRMVKENNRMCFFYGVSGVDMFVPQNTLTIVAFGDSLIQQGFWLDHLKQNLSEHGMTDIAVLNRGVGGSRVLQDTDSTEDGFYRHGVAGITRFETDVFGTTRADIVFVLHGINDIIHKKVHESNDKVTVADIIQGLTFYSQVAHKYCAKIYIGTLLPLKQSIFFSKKLEKARQEINQWIRNNHVYDGVIDFEKAVVSPDDPSLLQIAFDSGDGLHVSDFGGRALANSIDLSLFLK